MNTAVKIVSSSISKERRGPCLYLQNLVRKEHTCERNAQQNRDEREPGAGDAEGWGRVKTRGGGGRESAVTRSRGRG